MKALLLLLLLAVLCQGCNRLGKAEYLAWVTSYENGLHVKRAQNNFVFDVQYQPLDFIQLTNPSKNIDSFQYYMLKISSADGVGNIVSNGAQSPIEVQQNQYYFSYTFQQDIYLEDNGVKYPCLLFHFEQSTGRVNEKTFLLGFDNTFDSQEVKFVIDSDHFSSLPIRIKISKRNPTLQKA
jgi:hypothetical protein